MSVKFGDRADHSFLIQKAPRQLPGVLWGLMNKKGLACLEQNEDSWLTVKIFIYLSIYSFYVHWCFACCVFA